MKLTSINPVEVKTGGTTIQHFGYDGAGRQITTTNWMGGSSTLNVYYSSQWQAIEERLGTSDVETQNVFSIVYTDAPIFRDEDFDNSGSFSTSERTYLTQDANFNVTGMIGYTGSAWAVNEHAVYDAYGTAAFTDASWASGSNVNSMEFLHQGLRYDVTVGMYDDRARWYSNTLERFGQVDPTGYPDGLNDQQSYSDNPVTLLDPSGLSSSAKSPVLVQIGALSSAYSTVKNSGVAPCHRAEQIAVMLAISVEKNKLIDDYNAAGHSFNDLMNSLKDGAEKLKKTADYLNRYIAFRNWQLGRKNGTSFGTPDGSTNLNTGEFDEEAMSLDEAHEKLEATSDALEKVGSAIELFSGSMELAASKRGGDILIHSAAVLDAVLSLSKTVPGVSKMLGVITGYMKEIGTRLNELNDAYGEKALAAWANHQTPEQLGLDHGTSGNYVPFTRDWAVEILEDAKKESPAQAGNFDGVIKAAMAEHPGDEN